MKSRKIRKNEISFVETDKGTYNFLKFVEEVERKINSNPEILRQLKEVNEKFTSKVKEILENPQNSLYVAWMIDQLEHESPRYIYLKHQEFQGEEYEAEIDLLRRQFTLAKVE